MDNTLDTTLQHALETINQRRASTLDSVRSLIQTGKIEEAKKQARWLQGSQEWSVVVEMFKPTVEPHCVNGHLGTWDNPRGFTWIVQCHTCKEEEQAQAAANRAAWEAEWRAREEADEAETRRTFRHRPLEELDTMLQTIGVPSRFLRAVVKRLESLSESLYLTGQKGTGKTHMAAAIIREIVLDKTPYHNCSSLQWVSVPDLLLEIRASFRDGSDRSEASIIEQYSDCRVLILDDLGAEKTTEWSLQTLYTIIDRRYREER